MPIGFRNQYQTIQSPSNYDPLADARTVLQTTPDYAEMWEKRRARRDAQVNALRTLMSSRPDLYKGAEANVSQWGEVSGNEEFRNAGKLTKKNDLNQKVVNESTKTRIDKDADNLELGKQVMEADLDTGKQGIINEQGEVQNALYTKGSTNRVKGTENAVDDPNSNLNTNNLQRVKDAVGTVLGLNKITPQLSGTGTNTVGSPTGTTANNNPYLFGQAPPPDNYVEAPEPDPNVPTLPPANPNTGAGTGTGNVNTFTKETESNSNRAGVAVGQNGHYKYDQSIKGGLSMKGAPMYETVTKNAEGIVDEDIGDYGSYLNQAQLAQINSMNANLLHGAAPSDGGWGDVAARRQQFVERNMGKWLRGEDPTAHVSQEGGNTISYDKTEVSQGEEFGQSSSTNIDIRNAGAKSSATGTNMPGGGGNQSPKDFMADFEFNGQNVSTTPVLRNGKWYHDYGGGTATLWGTDSDSRNKLWNVIKQTVGQKNNSWQVINPTTGKSYGSSELIAKNNSIDAFLGKVYNDQGIILQGPNGNIINLIPSDIGGGKKGHYKGYSIGPGSFTDQTLVSTLMGTQRINKAGTQKQNNPPNNLPGVN